MERQQVSLKHFDALRFKYGSHSEAARQLGITPTYYRYVRKTGKMSESLARLIMLMTKENFRG